MKILTLNAHSLSEDNSLRKLAQFTDFVLREQPDLIALQESNQTMHASVADGDMLTGMVPTDSAIPIRCDNHAAWCAYLLRKAGLPVSWAWLPVKTGYGRFDEGLAVLSLRRPILETDAVQLSRRCDYADWRTRKALAVRLEGAPDWFYTVHMGWWNDPEEPFLYQWQNLCRSASARAENGCVWLLGDFNSPAEVRGEGYDRIRADGWQDAWLLAEETSGGATVRGLIDGWKNRAGNSSGMRIDHIWLSRFLPIRRARVVFDGINEPQVSDHSGVLLET